MTESATATIASTPIDSTTTQYTLTLTDTGTTAIGTFWFAWVPGKDFLATQPLSVTNPTGWGDTITHGGASDGYAIEWVASAGALQPGGSASFAFTSTDTPAAVSGNSVFYPTRPVTTSVVYSGAPFSDAGVTITASAACFAQGTRIRTIRGEIPAEALSVGDMVLTHAGEARPIVWIGQRRIEFNGGRASRQLWPVRVRRGAFGAGMPVRDLLLSPEHAVFHAGLLHPVSDLVNGTTIAQEPVAQITYWHVELETHDVLLAEGLPVESFLENSNRHDFEHGNVLTLRPQLSSSENAPAIPYAPLCRQGESLEALRTILEARARQLAAQVQMQAIA